MLCSKNVGENLKYCKKFEMKTINRFKNFYLIKILLYKRWCEFINHDENRMRHMNSYYNTIKIFDPIDEMRIRY